MFIGFDSNSLPSPAPSVIIRRIQKVHLVTSFGQFNRIMMFGQFHFTPGLWGENQNGFIGEPGWNLQRILSFLLSIQDTWESKESDPGVQWPRENRLSYTQDTGRPAG